MLAAASPKVLEHANAQVHIVLLYRCDRYLPVAHLPSTALCFRIHN
jgi:hypothetical protein